MDRTESVQLKLDDLLQIDKLCDEFERKLLRGTQQSIEEFLVRIDDCAQPALLKELLALELDHSELQTPFSEYVRRFPNKRTLLETVFEEMDLVDPGNAKIGPYIVLKKLARGGMGIVYLAEDPRLERKVAIKLLIREHRQKPKWLRRFVKEAKFASALNHPNILTIYDIGDEKGMPFLATEFIEGITLRERIANRPFEILEILELATQITNGMVAAHEHGIVHRDLKADNIMIRDDGLVKILDFGLATLDPINAHDPMLHSSSRSISGTIHFMSPEQSRGEEVTAATDVFSFGVLLYFMTTTKLPFRGRSLTDVLVSVINSDPEPMEAEATSIPTELKELIFQCLEKEASQRPIFPEIAKVIARIRKQANVKRHQPSRDGREFDAVEATPSSRTEAGLAKLTTPVELQPSPVRYARSQDFNIAWQEIGSGPIDIVFVMGWVSHLEWFWQDPAFASFLRRLATFSRVILFDKRGTGLSDKVPVNELPGLETRMDDVRAVMEAAGSKRAVLCGVSEGGPLCALFAATYPQKTCAIVMIGSYSRRLWAEDYPWGRTREDLAKFLHEIAENWGGPLGLKDRAPSMADHPEFKNWWATYLRMGASPGAAVALTKMNAEIDVRPILPSIQVPTLVIHRSGDRCLLVEEGRHMAEQIPRAKFIELPGEDHLPFVGDARGILNEIELFLIDLSTSHLPDCVLATVLHIEFGGSEHDDQWRSLTERAQHEIALFHGQEFGANTNLIQVLFDGPVRSILCALAIAKLANQGGVSIKCGLATGMCYSDRTIIHGPAVEGARQVAGCSKNASILLTQTLRNLVSGSDFSFVKTNYQIDMEEGIYELEI